MKKRTESNSAQSYYSWGKTYAQSQILSARQRAIKKEYEILKNTPLKDLIGKKMHLL